MILFQLVTKEKSTDAVKKSKPQRLKGCKHKDKELMEIALFQSVRTKRGRLIV
jgi:hypothetical protein